MSNQVTVYVIDSGPSMVSPVRGEELTACEWVSRYVLDKLEDRAIFARKTDVVAVYIGKKQAHAFAMPTWDSILDCREEIAAQSGEGPVDGIVGSTDHAMAELLNWVQRRKPIKRVIVLTDQVKYDDLSTEKLAKRAAADGIDLAFAIVNPSGVEGLNLNWGNFADAASRIGRSAKVVQGTSSFKGDLTLGGAEFPQLRIGIQCVSATRASNPPVAHMVHKGEQVKRVSEQKVEGELVPEGEIQEAYPYGSGYVLVDDYVKNRTKKSAEPAFEIMGFVESIPPWYSLGPMDFVVAASTASAFALSAFVRALKQSGGYAVARMARRGGSTEICVLEPLLYATETGTVIDCLLRTPIPFADDNRHMDFFKLHSSPEAQGVMDEIVDCMEITDGPGINGESIENALSSRIMRFIKQKAVDGIDDIPPPPHSPEVELKGDPSSLFETLVSLLPIEKEEKLPPKDVEQSILATGGELDIEGILNN